ncbi:hypothetical protein PBY51_005369 [Eleginops maclovinus]|uniref:Uncharacterized protein n=1 Tax=Eleginops maclovinus TaxID=56733 RepID=A0AAN7X627_ELEMC|nr:hypothetical protein PBY51_005369 [Eleginops maclovinus]
MANKRSDCTQIVFTTSLQMKTICVSLFHTLCSVLWLAGAVKGSLAVQPAVGALKAAARDQYPTLTVVVGVWMGLATHCLPPIVLKDTHLPSAQDDRAEWLVMIMITEGEWDTWRDRLRS